MSINWNQIDLGAVDSFAEAVEAGFTGTHAEWAQLMANVAEYAEDAQEAAETAETAKTDAIAAKTAAEDAQTAAETAKAAAETAAQRDVNEWLAEHITNPDSPPLDRTLSSSSAAAPADMVGTINSALSKMTIEETLLQSELPGTTTTVTMDSDGNPTSIVHTANNETMRTDTFVWGTGTVTETRTLASGKYITITTNLDTLAQTISDVQEVA